MAKGHSTSETGVVIASKAVREDMHYRTTVRLDRSGKEVEVRFPDQKRVGQAVRITH
jgi:hypothetical protein